MSKTVKKKLKVTAIICPKCGTILWSRYRHDYNVCPTDQCCFIDGGQQDYYRMGFHTISTEEVNTYSVGEIQLITLNLTDKQFQLGHMKGSEMSKILYKKDKK